MGGDASFSFSFSPDDLSSLENYSRCSDDLGLKFEDEVMNNPSGFDSGEFDRVGLRRNSSNDEEFAVNLRKRLWLNAYREIIHSYRDSSVRLKSLDETRRLILSYTPGSWMDKEDGLKLSDYDVPRTITLLLVGPKGSGKSSLINRISRVFEDDKLASDRAQVSYSSSTRDGTYFLQGYMIPRRSNSFCLFDTRSLSDDLYDNNDLLRSWMTKGVRNGELVIRESDDSSLRTMLKCKIRDRSMLSSTLRKVNFVIFVIDGLSVLRYMNGDAEEDAWHAEMLAPTFNFPYLSFKDDKPPIVVTHGDLLSMEERARVRIYLGELLGVPPTTQIFDIPESTDPFTELAILDMLKYSLEHADKNLPRRSWVSQKLCPAKSSLQQAFKSYFFALLFLGLALGVNVAKERHLLSGLRGLSLSSSFDHHHGPLVNQTLNHLGQTHLNPTNQSASSHDHSHDLPPTTRDNNLSGKLQQLNSTIQSTSYHGHQHRKPPATAGEHNQSSELHQPSMQSQMATEATDKPPRGPARPKSGFAKHRSRDHQPKGPKKNQSCKQHEAVEPEQAISWEARTRLWLE